MTKTINRADIAQIKSKFNYEMRQALEAVESKKIPNSAWWTMFEQAEVFIRISQRILDRAHSSNGLQRCVDIGNISMPLEFRRKGIFTRLVATIHELTDLPIFLENANDHFDWVAHLIINHGWLLHYSTVRFDFRSGAYCLWRPGVPKGHPIPRPYCGQLIKAYTP